MDYRVFYSLISEYRNKKISRAMFVLEWGFAQRKAGAAAV
jgi:hypothetical protein